MNQKKYKMEKYYKYIKELDKKISDIVIKCENKKEDINKLKNILSKSLDIFDEYNFNFENKENKFIIDYSIILDNIININIEFLQGGDDLFFKYNYIFILSKYGEVLNDITNDFIIRLYDEDEI